MKKLLFLLSFTFVLISCDRQLNKSVFTPLSVEDLSKTLKKDSTFGDIYKIIRRKCDSESLDDVIKAKYYSITYKDIFNYISYAKDSDYFNPLIEEWKKEWSSKYGKYDIKIDSVFEYWKKYKKDNGLDTYVKIELTKIDKEYYSYSNDVRKINLGFTLTPLKGKIDQLIFSYYIEPKNNDNGESYSSFSGKKRYLLSETLSEPRFQYWEVNYFDKDKLKEHTLSSFLRDYNIHIKIEEIRIDGINKTEDNLDIPESVNHYLKYYELWFDKSKIAKDLLNIDYVYEDEYLDQKKLEKINKKYPLVSEFFH